MARRRYKTVFPEIQRISTERFSEIVSVLLSISAILLSLPSVINRDGGHSQIRSIWSCFDHSGSLFWACPEVETVSRLSKYYGKTFSKQAKVARQVQWKIAQYSLNFKRHFKYCSSLRVFVLNGRLAVKVITSIARSREVT